MQEPIQKEILKTIDHPSSSHVRTIRDVNYIAYLQHVNRHGCSCQDDFDSGVYDPLKRISISARLSTKLKDSTNIKQRKTTNEDSVIVKCITTSKVEPDTEKPLQPSLNDMQTRSDISWNKWLQEKFNSIGSTARTRSG